MEKCMADKNCTYVLDTTYTDSLGHTIVEKKCIVTEGGEGEKACCKNNPSCDKKTEAEKKNAV